MLPNLHKFSYLKSVNAEYIDEALNRYLKDPNSVDDSWRYFFEGIELGTELAALVKVTGAAPTPTAPSSDLMAEARVAELIRAYREYGRLLADIDPLHAPPSSHPALELSSFGLTNTDLTRTFHAAKFLGFSGPAPLIEIIARLKSAYCGTVAVEASMITDKTQREWIQNKIESGAARASLDSATRKRIHHRLSESESFERFLAAKYVAAKRFSIEGAEAAIPALDCVIETAADLGAKEFVIGMPHRGRLNILVHTMGKNPEFVLTEFEGNYHVDYSEGEGDVKYHKGYSRDFTTPNGKAVHLSLASNPSHLEFVNPVVEGIARAKQQILGDSARGQVVPILFHGDAAFAGQGVVYETINLAQLDGYATGGTIHFIINNQVGFTTSPKDARSTTYCTDLARMLEVPIFHVNGDDPEAVWNVAKLAIEFRQKFKKDVFIDMICYRRHGHNEGDEPSFTQPILYKEIKAHASTRELYGRKLVNDGVYKVEEEKAVIDTIMAKLSAAQQIAKAEAPHPAAPTLGGRWKGLKRGNEQDMLGANPKTAVAAKTLIELATRINTFPPSFHLHAKLGRLFEGRLKAVQDGQGIDWGNGEALAFASILADGDGVRLSGQDAERGTFTHRHCALNDFETGEKYSPFNKVGEKQGVFSVHNSHLSETGVMGFEYGFSLGEPHALTLWEAQFGDFANGAQVIIDQFLCSGESKWSRMSGLVLLLPHGFEGQGPEHSSARLERFLQLSGRGNWSICNFTTPAQLFHALRRQLKREFRKPLVVMTPKSLLRLPAAVSSLSDFCDGSFQEVIDDFEAAQQAPKVRRVVLCSGKVFYDLAAEKAAKKHSDVAIVRVEQLYPWAASRVNAILTQYSNAKELFWVQEEPRNMGAWSHVLQQDIGGRAITYIGRDIGAAPAVGSDKLHKKEQLSLLEQALS